MLDKVYQKIREDFPQHVLVLGEGNPQAKILLIGEAPGKTEVELKRPFVGQAGKNLDRFLEILNLKREEIYITNSVKFRPTRVSEFGSVANRTPTPEEIALFRGYLMEEVEIINPKVIVTLGNIPLRSVLNKMDVTIGANHGKPIHSVKTGRYLFPLYHPASIIYKKELAVVYEEDLRKLSLFVAELESAQKKTPDLAEALK